MKLLIFKTNIANESRIKKVNALLAYNPGLMDWSIDMEDRDKVLRIEAEDQVDESDVMEIVNSWGVECYSMED
ncbi:MULTISPECIES: hypothetical protein [Roseivirga]|jgi:hypothetical protein|uniref:HMA domain-containing protein n=1 Tax=Roseivirga spongicola TaxID=333140 RepID=A0A150WZG4_9BACT|nr:MULTISPECIES: hypothetical protein [Roseivirga]PWL27971.1 MAG: hypothetical protein DCO95_15985 [Roseivirga sp. XM-24bin3]KYG71875.1 hypothetical protein AWW68_17820 [Roseivirga spongicola]MBO6496369.1 hypothetical protein [Roseivirga sp.]MBO6662149.1 hypothetical protein [Roseivirga sp.]MBO6910123.1 hypothetical protein [Roseivirga sp.]|tara:strand:+ start:192 stop:410 length:219 start_codon:yes stop_codon:yes gene_type:complete